jgi:hypothetical protein
MGAGVITVASAAGSSTKIHACVVKHTKVLHLGRCKSGETKISWNRRGPVGPRGPRGFTGATGPSNTYVFSYNANGEGTSPTPPPLDGNESGTLLTLPPGHYLLHYVMGVYEHDASAVDYDGCQPTYTPSGGTSFVGGFYDVGIPAGSGFDFGSGTLDETLTATAPTTTVTIGCSNFGGGGGGSIQNFTVVATKVGSLSVTGNAPVPSLRHALRRGPNS